LRINELENQEYSGIVDRAEKRIEEAIQSALVCEPLHNDEIEILSFPIAVMMVSTSKDAFLKRRYALAEAKRAYGLLKQESRDKLIQIAIALNWKVRKTKPETSDFALHFTDYLRNTTGFHETKWKLINRTVHRGEVHITQDETARLIAEEVRKHVEKKLETQVDFQLPTEIANRVQKLAALFQSKRGKISFEEMPKEVVMDAFPPCIRELRKRALAGQHISHVGRFTLTSFLINSGMTVDAVVDCFRSASDFNERMTRYQAEHIGGGRGSRTKYIPPKCETLRTHGVCPEMDDICRRIRHPMGYYRRKIRQMQPVPKPQTPAVS
jgi:DNA primase large subunit